MSTGPLRVALASCVLGYVAGTGGVGGGGDGWCDLCTTTLRNMQYQTGPWCVEGGLYSDLGPKVVCSRRDDHWFAAFVVIQPPPCPGGLVPTNESTESCLPALCSIPRLAVHTFDRSISSDYERWVEQPLWNPLR
jgi:hypothetical protein